MVGSGSIVQKSWPYRQDGGGGGGGASVCVCACVCVCVCVCGGQGCGRGGQTQYSRKITRSLGNLKNCSAQTLHIDIEYCIY